MENLSIILEKLDKIEQNQRMLFNFVGKIISERNLLEEVDIFCCEKNIKFPSNYLPDLVTQEDIEKVSSILIKYSDIFNEISELKWQSLFRDIERDSELSDDKLARILKYLYITGKYANVIERITKNGPVEYKNICGKNNKII